MSKAILNEFVDSLFPPICHVCKSKEGIGENVCKNCLKLELIDCDLNNCEICQEKIEDNSFFKVCYYCMLNPPLVEELRSVFYYDQKSKSLLFTYKYDPHHSLSKAISSIILKSLPNYFAPKTKIDCIITIPSASTTLRKRAFNHSALLAQNLVNYFNAPYYPQALKSARKRKPQIGLENYERFKNVVGAFKAKTKYVSDRNVLIFDDVITTGASINEATKVCLNAGAKKVYALSFLRSKNFSSRRLQLV